jgi:hypothetical protein
MAEKRKALRDTAGGPFRSRGERLPSLHHSITSVLLWRGARPLTARSLLATRPRPPGILLYLALRRSVAFVAVPAAPRRRPQASFGSRASCSINALRQQKFPSWDHLPCCQKSPTRISLRVGLLSRTCQGVDHQHGFLTRIGAVGS